MVSLFILTARPVPEESSSGSGDDARVAEGFRRWGRLLPGTRAQRGEALPTSCPSVSQDANLVPKTQARLQDRKTHRGPSAMTGL